MISLLGIQWGRKGWWLITLFFFKRIKKSFLSDLEMSYSALAKHNSPEEIRKHDVASIFHYIIETF